MKDKKLLFDRKCHVLYSRPCKEEIRAKIALHYPAAEFAIRHGLTDIMPALCNVDYASMELLHARLVRTTTCVDGCRCDYTICGDYDAFYENMR